MSARPKLPHRANRRRGSSSPELLQIVQGHHGWVVGIAWCDLLAIELLDQQANCHLAAHVRGLLQEPLDPAILQRLQERLRDVVPAEEGNVTALRGGRGGSPVA